MMEYRKIPPHLEESIPYIKIFEDVRKKYQLSRSEALLHFVKEEPDIDYLVFGVEKKRTVDGRHDIIWKEDRCKSFYQ